ncbi:S9 family peptidase [bacterium]|nr:S9 family peptidase [bacterium]
MKKIKKLSVWFLASLMLIFLWNFPAFSKEKSLFTIDDYFQVRSMRVADMSEDGTWLACTLRTRADRLPRNNYRYGDPTYVAPFQMKVMVINTQTGKNQEVFNRKKQVRGLTWSPDGKKLAFFHKKEKNYHLTLWKRETGELETLDIPHKIASDSYLNWSPDGEKLYFAVRSSDWREKTSEMFQSATKGPIIIHDSEKPFLMWEKIRRRSLLKVPVVWDREEGVLNRMLPEIPLVSLQFSKDGTFLVYEKDVTEETSYKVIFGKRKELKILQIPEGNPRTLLEPYMRRRIRWSKDKTVLAYSKEGDVYVMDVSEKEPHCLTEKEKEKEEKDKKKEEEKQKFNVLRVSPKGEKILCTSSPSVPKEEQPYRRRTSAQQYWLFDAQTGEKRLIYELDQEPRKRPHLDVVDWSPDGESLYFSYSASNKYDRGLKKLNLENHRMTDLIRSDHRYRRWEMSENGNVFVYTDSDGDYPADWYSADKEFSRIQKLTDLNPHLKDKALSHTRLISYRDADGKKLHGVLYYPAHYEKGKKYPLITEVYEKYFHNGFNPKLNIFTSVGYAVLHPSVDFNKGYPGEAWAKGALSAINKVIEMGVADPEKLGIQGTSYGGYAVGLLIAQTDRFKAAINNSGKVNMVSFYTQSPRLGVRNIHAPERSQDRIGGTLWEYPERYLAHSAILFADRIQTPLLCITGDQDPNVEELQSQEIYYALRRLGKKVVWLRYHNGAHGGPQTNEERKHMYKKMLDWYDTYLKKDPTS